MARLGGVCWNVCADLADSCGVRVWTRHRNTQLANLMDGGRPVYIVGPASLVWSQVPLVVCGFNSCVQGVLLGPVSDGGVEVVKSKNSLMSREGSCQ
jgi:hypothetical protein